MKKKAVLFAMLALFAVCASGQDNLLSQNGSQSQQMRMDVAVLFAAWLSHDLETLRLFAEVEKQLLLQKSVSINNGFDIELSTGSVTYRMGSKGGVTFNPNVSVSVPQAQNLKASVSSDVKILESGNTASTSLSLGIDIISDVKDKRKVALLTAERNVLVAKRNLQNRALSSERDFYVALKQLYDIASSMEVAQRDLYEHKMEFEKLQAQGYNAASSQYRTAQMKVLSDEHTVENYRRYLESSTAIFASKCGIEYTGDNALDFLPDAIPVVEPVDVKSFEKSKYTKIENAVWTNYINDLIRKADKDFLLGINGGYTFANENTSGSNTIDAGATAKFQGLSMSAGANIPIASDISSPAFTFGVGIKPNDFRLRSITKKQNVLSEEQEQISIAQAERDYDTDMLAAFRELVDIQWSRKSNTEYYDMYHALESDTARWYADGIITESEYRSAQVNKERYRLDLLCDVIDLILYNNDTKLMFCRDEEIK